MNKEIPYTASCQQANTSTRLTSTIHFWRVPGSSVVPLKARTHRQLRPCAVTVGRTGEAGVIGGSVGPRVTTLRGKSGESSWDMRGPWWRYSWDLYHQL